VEVRLLGPLTVVVDGRPIDLGGTRQRELVALLILARNHALPVDELADRLWPDELPATAIKTIQVYVSRLRALLGDEATRLETVGGGYRLRLEDDEVDAVRFETMVRAGRDQVAADPRAAEQTLTRAMALWQGPALADVSSLPFAQAEADRLDGHRVELDDLDEVRIRTGRAREAIPRLRAAVRERPEREHTWAKLMRALYADGRQVDALAAYREARTYLSRELGLEPGPELQALEQAILRHEVEEPGQVVTGPVPGVATRTTARDEAQTAETSTLRERSTRATIRGPASAPLALVIVVAIVLVVGVAALRSSGASTATPFPSAGAPAATSPIAAASSIASAGASVSHPPEPSRIVVAPDLNDGQWVPTELIAGTWTWERFQPELTLTTRSTWWAGMDNPDGASLLLLEPPSARDGVVIGEVDFVRPQLVLDKPCYLPETSRILDTGASSFIDWIRSHPLLEADVVRPFDLGRYPGLTVDARVARPKTSKDCPEEADSVSLLRRIPLFPAVGHSFPLFSHDRARFVAVNVADAPPVVIIVRADEDRWDSFIELAQPVLEAIEVR
jgi:DNA-binding transcriptional activator of the SARP family